MKWESNNLPDKKFIIIDTNLRITDEHVEIVLTNYFYVYILCICSFSENEMIKKLIQHGNSLALIIDKPIMELLHIENDTPLELSTDGDNIIISPVKDKKRFNRLSNSLESINENHGATLKKLAK